MDVSVSGRDVLDKVYTTGITASVDTRFRFSGRPQFTGRLYVPATGVAIMGQISTPWISFHTDALVVALQETVLILI